MSLGEKLSKISQNLQETKAEEEKKGKEKELEPIRAQIKKIENEKHQLELIKGSLELKSDEKTGKGMKEYSKDTEEKDKKESTQLDALVEKNKEALQTMNIENKDQLAENPEFAEEAEVVSYKNTKEQTKGLKISDASLQEKLKTFGVDVDAENFSYDSAEKALAEKIQSLDQDLAQEKLKTPEGKEEVINTLSKSIEKNIPEAYFSKDEKNGAQMLSFSRQNREILIRGEKTTFKNWHESKLIPKEAEELEKTYGPDIIKEATKKAYQNKIESAFEQSDKASNNIDKKLKQDLERSSPEKWAEANKAVQVFQELAVNFKNTLKEKSEELKAKGVNFNPVSVQNYGGEYEKYASLTEYKDDNQLIAATSKNPDTYPPRLNFDALKTYAEKRIEHIKELTENVKKLETEADINKFTRGEKSGIGKAHKNILSSEFKDDVKRPVYYANEQSWAQTKVIGLMKFKSYQEAMAHFEKQAIDRETTKQKFLEAVGTAMDAQTIRTELRNEIETQNFTSSIGNIENKIASIEEARNEAVKLSSELLKLQAELPNEEVILNGTIITIPSIGKQLEQLKKDQEIEKQNLKNLKQKIIDHGASKPKLFRKNAWEKELAEYKQQEKELEEKIRKMGAEEYTALYKKYYFQIPIDRYSSIRNMLDKQININGKPNEIFDNLKNELAEVAHRKVPESITKLYGEYMALEKKLS